MSARLLVIFVVIFETTLAQRGSPCTTPNGENVTCVSVRRCKVIKNAVRTGDSSAVEFAKKSQCGHDSEPLVCCGASGYLLDRSTTKPENRRSVEKEAVEAIILSNFNTKALPNRTVCGLENIENRIYGGTETEIGEFPWAVALEYISKRSGENAGIKCGGTLINNRYVMTAAHCIKHNEFKLTKAWLGEWQISKDPDCKKLIAHEECADRVRKVNIKTEISHPFYSTSGNNDIGLLRLEEDVTYTDYIRPICLPPPNLPIPEIGTILTVVGWGATENGTSSDIKLKVEVPLLSNINCKIKVENEAINANQVCAGGEPGKDSCEGDSGGPLMRTYEEKVSQQVQWYQEGIVSFGIGCGSVEVPGIYTRVSRYTMWVVRSIKID